MKQKSVKELRRFGLSVGGVFLILAGLLFWRDKFIYPYMATFGATLFILGIFAPIKLALPEAYWMKFAEKLSIISTHLILVITYFFMITPMGLLLRILGKDLLSLKIDKKSKTYWAKVDKEGSSTRYYTPH